MKHHVLNISKATKRRRDRFVVVREVDRFLDGRLILALVPDAHEYNHEQLARIQAEALDKVEPC
jgi:hypothetical protein